MNLGGAIREQRQKKGVGIKTLSEEVGVNYTHLSKIENGHLKPSKELLLRLAAALNADADQWVLLAGYLPDDIWRLAERDPAFFISIIRKSIKPEKTMQMPRRKIKNAVISLFTGAGGMDLGLEEAGFNTAVCVEFNPIFRETIKKNKPEWRPIDEFNGDITKISTKLILEKAGLKVGEAALVVGGAPCQPFSNMGSGLGVKDARGTLFQDFIRVVKEAKPKGFIFENVEGLTQSKHKIVVETLEKAFRDIGYSVGSNVLLAADYGVPQKRKRLFVIGCRDDVKPEFPKATHAKKPSDGLMPWVTVKEAFSKLTKEDYRKSHCLSMNHSPEMLNKMSRVPAGGNFKDLPARLLPACWKSGKYQGQDTFGRVKWQEPSVTIRTCGYNPTKGRYIHPKENRGLNTIEMAALQSFPPDHVFVGGLKAIGEQIGNAVPPLLAEAVGHSMMRAIKQIEE